MEKLGFGQRFVKRVSPIFIEMDSGSRPEWHKPTKILYQTGSFLYTLTNI